MSVHIIPSTKTKNIGTPFFLNPNASLPASNSTAPIISSNSKCGLKPFASLRRVSSLAEGYGGFFFRWRFLGLKGQLTSTRLMKTKILSKYDELISWNDGIE